MPHSHIRIPEHVVHRTFPTETVVLNLRTGKYHGLNRTAGRMLELLAEQGEVDRTAELLAEEFGHSLEEVRRDVEQLCRDLLERELIEAGEGAG